MTTTKWNWAVLMCAAAIALLVQVPPAQAEEVNFDGPGYVAGAVPPEPWTDRYTALGEPYADLVYQVVAGAGVGGSQALTVYNNGYYEGAAVYPLVTPLVPGNGPQQISVKLDPPQNGQYNFTFFGGVYIGRGGWMQDSSAIWRGVNFQKNDWGYAGGDQPTDFPITGPNGVMGYFTPSASQNYYTITYDINAAFDTIVVTVTAPGGATLTQTTGWDGGPINKIWFWDSNDNYNYGQPVYYDDLTTTGEPPASPTVEAGTNLPWVYQNTPTTTGNRHLAVLTVAVSDLSGYSVDVRTFGGTGEVVIQPTADPLVWNILGGPRSTGGAGTGPVTLLVQVSGRAMMLMTEVNLTVRALGDLDGVGGVNGQDKLLINKRLSGLVPNGPEFDLDCLGGCNGQDKLILNKILSGIAIP